MNPYELLEVKHSASATEIRRQYRRLARRWHPDKNPDDPVQADRLFKQIAEAYRILSDPKERHLWDLRHSFAGRKTRTLWDRLREEKDNPTSQALVVLYDLANDQSAKGFKRWQELKEKGHTDLGKLLEGRDYRDCCFLLAEQLVARGYVEEAIDMYHQVYWAEHRKPLMDYYKSETSERLLDLLTGPGRKSRNPQAKIRDIKRSLCYAHTVGLRRRLLSLLSNQAYKLGDHDLALKASRGVARQGGNVSRLLVEKSRKMEDKSHGVC